MNTPEYQRQWRLANLEKARAYGRKWDAANREKKKIYNFRRVYGDNGQKHLSIQLELQKNRCAICNRPFITTPNLDHNHETNQLRGALCSPCNLGLGKFREDVNILSRTIEYLNKWGKSGGA